MLSETPENQLEINLDMIQLTKKGVSRLIIFGRHLKSAWKKNDLLIEKSCFHLQSRGLYMKTLIYLALKTNKTAIGLTYI